MFACEMCGKVFKHKNHLQRHERESCKFKGVKRRKIDVEPSSSKLTCRSCNIQVEVDKWAPHCRTNEHKNNSCIQLEDGIQVMQSAFKSRIATYRVSPQTYHIDYKSFFEEIKGKVISLFEEALRVHTTFKCSLEVFSSYLLPSQETTDIKSFNTVYKVVTHSDSLDEIYESFVNNILKKSEEFQEKDSGKQSIIGNI